MGHSVLEPYLDSYRVVAEQLANTPAGTAFDKNAFVRACLNTGQQLYLQRQLVSSESIAKAMFENGIKVAKDYSLLEKDQDEKVVAQRIAFANDMRTWGRRVRALRSLASGSMLPNMMGQQWGIPFQM